MLSQPVGLYRDTRPNISEITLKEGLTAVIFSDGLVHAGSRTGESLDIASCLQELLEEEDPTPELIADDLLRLAVTLDQGRPVDDVTIVVLRVTGSTGDLVRRMSVQLPLDS